MLKIRRCDDKCRSDKIFLLTMRRQLAVIFFLVSSFYGTVSSCPSGWMTHGSSCYHFSHDTETWIGAMQFCREFHGNLLEVDSASENAYIEAQVKLNNVHYWMALSDAEEEGTWVWMTSGTTLIKDSFSDWYPGQPDNFKGDENCGCMYMVNNDVHWNDCTCHDNIHYICEKLDDAGEIVG